MILARLKVFFQTLPAKRGREAIKAYAFLSLPIFLLAGGAFLVTHVFLTPAGTQSANLHQVTAAKAAAPARDIPGPINGLLFTAEEAKVWQNRRPLAVVIENFAPDARPQSGLVNADLVYETLAEGGITRYLALYLTNLGPVTLGPIRSVRTYFLDWAEEYDAAIAHVGGNHDALVRIRPEGVKDLDEFWTPGYSRVSNRVAPHNVYTNTDNLWGVAQRLGYTGASSFQSWKFKEEAPVSARPAAQVLKLGFLGNPDYAVTWAYSTKDNEYLRSVGGREDVDKNNYQRIVAKTVVVEEVIFQTGKTDIGENTVILGDKGSSGRAIVFTDGVATEGTWSKGSTTDRTIFKDKNGVEIPFNRGPIWIEVVPVGSPGEY